MRHVTREEMREIDRRAIEEHGIPVDTLMENAGRAVAEAVVERASRESPVTVLCGKGNNGGDGFVAARLLADEDFEVEVIALEKSYDPSTATGRNWEAARGDDRIHFAGRIKRRPMAVFVDALFGTGLTREVRGFARELIEHVNSRDRRWFPVVAVDIPSGLDANTGRVLGAAIEASVTVTMGLPKAGFRSKAARKHVGDLVVADIGFPPALLKG